MRRIPVRSLADRTETPVADVRVQRVQEADNRQPAFERGLDVGPNQPWPDGSLVIGAVALARITTMTSPVFGRPRISRAKAERSQQGRARQYDARLHERAHRQRDGQQLVGSQRRIVPDRSVDYVQAASVPDESFAKG